MHTNSQAPPVKQQPPPIVVHSGSGDNDAGTATASGSASSYITSASPMPLYMPSAGVVNYQMISPHPLHHPHHPYVMSPPVMHNPPTNDPEYVNRTDVSNSISSASTYFYGSPYPHYYQNPAVFEDSRSYPPPHVWEQSPYPVPFHQEPPQQQFQPADCKQGSFAVPAPVNKTTKQTTSAEEVAKVEERSVSSSTPTESFRSPNSTPYPTAFYQAKPEHFPGVPKPMQPYQTPQRVAGVQMEFIKMVGPDSSSAPVGTHSVLPPNMYHMPHSHSIVYPSTQDNYGPKPEHHHPMHPVQVPFAGSSQPFAYAQHYQQQQSHSQMSHSRQYVGHEILTSSGSMNPPIQLAHTLSSSELIKKPRRKRSALRADLIFCGLYTDPATEENCKTKTAAFYDIPEDDDEDEEEEHLTQEQDENGEKESAARSPQKSGIPPHLLGKPVHLSRIRVWVDNDKKSFYDCTCGKRKPTQDFKKILHHVEGHNVSQFPCDVCGRVFKHHLGRNSHQRVHKLQEQSAAQGSFVDTA